MSVVYKNSNEFPSDGGVTFKGKFYKADFMISFPVDNEINVDNCICIFSIVSRVNLTTRQYVGAKFYEKLTNENVIESINGYLPERVFCFTETAFPLDTFMKENTFKRFGT